MEKSPLSKNLNISAPYRFEFSSLIMHPKKMTLFSNIKPPEKQPPLLYSEA